MVRPDIPMQGPPQQAFDSMGATGGPLLGKPKEQPNMAVYEDEQAKPVNRVRLIEFNKTLTKYKAGKTNLEDRIIKSQQWWKMRNASVEASMGVNNAHDNFKPKSGWLHNVLTNKHADAMESYPEPIVKPREPNDQDEAERLTSILPVIYDENDFEDTYSNGWWDKLQTGTAVYKVTWDNDKLGGLGDVSIKNAELLNLYWEPGITDIQKSKYIFDVELHDNEELESEYPQLKGKLGTNQFEASKYIYDDNVSTEGKSTVIDVYYKVKVGSSIAVHFCKYVNDVVLFSTENGDGNGESGVYDDGMYPYVFDVLFPIKGSPCGYGYVDLCANTQIQLDLMDMALLENFILGAKPRYFFRQDGAVNEKDFMNLQKSLIHVAGNIDDTSLKVVDYKPLPDNYIGVYDRKINELRQVSGNTETATGASAGGLTSASAVAAMQEASGKLSRDAIRTGYRAHRKISLMIIERIRQFMDLPRQFRITGEMGQTEFSLYSNENLQPQHQGFIGDTDLGFRLPTFDVDVEAAKKASYNKTAQNDLALQLFQLGIFNPEYATPAIMLLDIMDFDGREELMQKIEQNGTLQQQLMQAQAMLAQLDPQAAMMNGAGQPPALAGGGPAISTAKNGETSNGENPIVQRARDRANQAAGV